MAVVWAKSNGNWTDTTLWAFWNEATQQIEDYGQVPQEGDTVYCNSYIVTFPNNSPISISIGNGTLTNKTNPYTNLTGGYFSYIGQRSNNILTANIESRDNDNYTFVFSAGYNSNILTINGNVIGVIEVVPSNTLRINGNVNGCFLFANSNSGMGLIINGNVDTQQYALARKNMYGYFTTFEINGNVELHDNQLITGGNNNTIRDVILNGNIHTTSLNPLISTSISSGYYIYLNGDFVSENGALLCTNFSQMRIGPNARMQLPDTNGTMMWFSAYAVSADYPSESNVKKDVPYAYGQMVGTYDIENLLPPESVVLKDYEYGDSDARKTGTMENEVIVEVDNTNTINVFPYKRRNNG